MKLFILFVLVFPLISCVVSDDEGSAFRDRERTQNRPRTANNRPDQEQSSSTGEQAPAEQQVPSPVSRPPQNADRNLIFPVEITDRLESIKLESSDNKRIHISAVGGNMSLLSPYSGSLTIKTSGDHFHFEVSILGGRKFNLLTEKTKTIVKVSDQSRVQSRQIIAETSGVATIYISKDSQDLVLCLGDITASIPIIKNLSLDNCS